MINNVLIMLMLSAQNPQELVDNAMSPENDYFSLLTDSFKNFFSLIFAIAIIFGIAILIRKIFLMKK